VNLKQKFEAMRNHHCTWCSTDNQWRNWRFEPGGTNLAERGPLATVWYAILVPKNSYVIPQKQKIFVGW